MHAVKPLVLIFSVLGNVTVILLAVALLSSLFLTTSLNFSDFGLDFVPAFEGETVAVASRTGAGFWAVGDAGDTEGERRHTGDEEGLAQGETPPGN